MNGKVFAYASADPLVDDSNRSAKGHTQPSIDTIGSGHQGAALDHEEPTHDQKSLLRISGSSVDGASEALLVCDSLWRPRSIAALIAIPERSQTSGKSARLLAKADP